MEFISTQVAVLKAFIDKMQEFLPVKYVYDENLDYTSALQKLRGDSQATRNKAKDFPFVAFNRSVLRTSQNPPADRTRSFKLTHLKEDEAELYKAGYAEFDVNFSLFSTKIQDVETLELCYVLREGVFSTKKLYLDTKAAIGFDLEYMVSFQDLSDKRFEIESVFYKSLSATATIRGFFLLFKNKSPLIQNIISAIYDFETKYLYSTLEITD